MKNKNLVTVVLLLGGLAAGFGGGYYFRNYQAQQMRANFAGGNGNFQRFVGNRNGGTMGPGGMRGGAAVGTILSMDDKSFTVKLPDGSSKIVLFSDTTSYTNTTTVTKNDLKVGSEVAVFGAPNSDGSVTANNVQLNPMFLRNSSPSPLPTSK